MYLYLYLFIIIIQFFVKICCVYELSRSFWNQNKQKKTSIIFKILCIDQNDFQERGDNKKKPCIKELERRKNATVIKLILL